MTRALRRRLDVLVVLCSTIVGVGLTYLLFSGLGGPLFLLYGLFSTGLVLLLAFWYVEAGSAGVPDSDEHADS